MLKRLRTAHPILYCILAEVLFLGSLFLSSLVLTVALVAAGADFSGLDEYLLSLVQELVGAGAAWLLLRRTGLLVGWSIIVVSFLSLPKHDILRQDSCTGL